MKKIFSFAAVLFAAMSMNAEVIDFTTTATDLADWTITEATQNASETDAEKAKFVYDIKGGVESQTWMTAEPNVVFSIKNGSDKAKAFVVYPGKCFEFGGKNGILTIKNVKIGSTIKLTVAAKGSTAANFADTTDADNKYPHGAVEVSTDLTLPIKDKDAEGADKDGYVWKTLEYMATASEVVIKEFAAGYRINAIELSTTTGVEELNATVKAQKIMENGQIYILKNGVKYNVLGAEVK